MEGLDLNGLIHLLPNEPALLLNLGDERHLVLSDLHIGFEKELSSKGIRLPSQTQKLLARIKALASSCGSASIILLGDVKHGTSKILPYEWSDIPEFFAELARLVDKITIVPGNHDGGLKALLPRNVEVSDTRGISFIRNGETVTLTHGHTWLHSEALSSDFLIMGHHHFTVEFRDGSGLRYSEQVWVIGRWRRERLSEIYMKNMGRKPLRDPIKELRGIVGMAVGSPRIVVMPAFNKLLGGRAINRGIDDKSSQLGPLFKEDLIDPPRTEVFLLDGTLLGRLSELRKRND